LGHKRCARHAALQHRFSAVSNTGNNSPEPCGNAAH
jgi:hypothetical protein